MTFARFFFTLFPIAKSTGLRPQRSMEEPGEHTQVPAGPLRDGTRQCRSPLSRSSEIRLGWKADIRSFADDLRFSAPAGEQSQPCTVSWRSSMPMKLAIFRARVSGFFTVSIR
jgi:hypothetical protein